MSPLGPWWRFTYRMLEYEKDTPGVYQLADSKGEIIYIGSSNEVKQRLMQHLQESADSCLKRNAVQFRVEYLADFESREQQLFEEHLAAYGAPPRCNRAA